MDNQHAEQQVPVFESDAWHTWSPREAISPNFKKDTEQRLLLIQSHGQRSTHGAWWCQVDHIQAETAYVITGQYLSSNIKHESTHISMIVTWLDQDGTWLVREYIDELTLLDDGWRQLHKHMAAPAGASSLKIELELKWLPTGTVYWRLPQLEVKPLPKRKVKLATTYIDPYVGMRSNLAGNLHVMTELIDRVGQHRPDLIVFSETIFDRLSKLPLADIAQPITGELVQVMRGKAQEIKAYVVFSMHEVDGNEYYITSVLIDRKGDVVGTYRKTHLPLAEAQMGIVPGDDYPVFETDFGKVGMLICYDQNYPEAARALRLQGAEVICISTAGDAPILTKARAVENGVYVVVAGIDGSKVMRTSHGVGRASRIINPEGTVIAEIGKGDEIDYCVAEVDLNQRFTDYWFSVGPAEGEPRNVLIKERRPDTYG